MLRERNVACQSMHPPESESKPPAVILLEDMPTYPHFLHEYLQKNKPCLISSDSVSSWPAFALWVDGLKDVSSCPAATDYSQPNFDYLREKYGDQVVSVARCSSRAFGDQEREDRPLREVIDLWKCGHGKELYVKDWHLAKSVRGKGYPPFYTTPQIFQDDWMNAFWEEEGKDDFRFVVSERRCCILDNVSDEIQYMGAAGTFTPLHRDVCKLPTFRVGVYLLLTTSRVQTLPTPGQQISQVQRFGISFRQACRTISADTPVVLRVRLCTTYEMWT
jgi:hypothetical protein